jgi:predicted PurR-regulated permease PerM
MAILESSTKNWTGLIDWLEVLFTSIVFRFIFAMALVYFLLNVYRFIKEGGNAEKRKDYGLAIMWSLIAMAAMISLWALVSIVTGTFGEKTVLPQINSGYLDSFR